MLAINLTIAKDAANVGIYVAERPDWPIVRNSPMEVGAGDRIRTGDIDLGKVALYQLSYSRSPGTIIVNRRRSCQTICNHNETKMLFSWWKMTRVC